MTSALLFFVQIFGSFLVASPVQAASPQNIISYQGRLLNSNRAPVSDASATILFELYTASSGGSCVWSNSSASCASATARTVTLTDGLFSENLGDTAASPAYAAIDDTIFGNNATLYLQVTVNGETLSPRKQIVSAPYAINAQLLDGFNSDADGATTAAIVAYNSSGNLVVTGNPGGAIANASVYINPASGDVAANDIIFGVANGGSPRFAVDAEGDTTVGGTLTMSADLIASAAGINLFDDASGGTTIDFGGVNADKANFINIATHGAQADSIIVGNNNASTTLSLTGGTAWSISGPGTGTFTNVNCGDCITWSDFVDLDTLDASTTVTLGGSNFTYNVAGAGNFQTTNTQGDVLTITQTGSFNYRLNNTQNPTFSIVNEGSSNAFVNLLGTGDFAIQDLAATFVTFSDTGAYSYTLDNADNPTYIITNNGSNDVVTNLAGTGDFLVQDNGATYATFSDAGTLTMTDTFVVGSASRSGQTVFNSQVTGNWTGALGKRDVSVAQINADYRANEAGGTDGTYSGLTVNAQISNNGDVNSLYGVYASAINNSADAAAVEGALFGLYGTSVNTQAVTVPEAMGVYGQVSATAGTITTGYGVRGTVISNAGAFTSAYGGYFENLNEGTTRYGVVGNATGGTNNYSGYFTQSMVLIDDNTNPTDTGPSFVAVGGGGDLFIRDSFEADGSFYAGDTTGTDEFVFSSAATAIPIFSLNVDALQNGQGLQVRRGNGVATDFTGILVNIDQQRTSAGTTGTALKVSNSGGGNSSAVHIVQNQVVDATTAPTAQALVIDVNEAANNDEVILIRSDADGGGLDTEFRFENDGDFFGDGAAYNAGADYAEFFSTTDNTLGDYEVTCWNPAQANGVQRCEAGDTNIVGVISTNPGFVGNNFVGAEGNLENNPNYALVGLVGQIDTYVSADAGPINIGDPLTTSTVRAGYAAKASGGSYIIGRALESLSSGTGTIKVLVQPMWYGGDMLTMNGEATTFTGDITLAGAQATAASPAVDSAGLSFVGSTWNGTGVNDVSLTLRNDILSGGSSRLSLTNDDGVDVMTFGSTGDLAIAGNFYPSDRGALQYGAYVYYDSTGAGYMKTNAAGWSSRSTGFSEMFASVDPLAAGDVVELADDASVRLSTGEAYSERIAGVVSSGSGFVAGSNSGSYAVVLSGRVQTNVTAENGEIAVGDPLTTSSRPGFAMKATDDGQILGYALESLPSGEGSILVLVRPQYVSRGTAVAEAPASLAVTSQDIETLNISGVLSMNGGDIVSVGTLSGIGTWEIQEDGDIVTNGQLTQVVRSLQNTRVSTYATTSTETLVQLSGTTTLRGGMARVSFEDVNPAFNDVISPDLTYRVLVTPNGITGQLYVTDRSNAGFIIRDANNGEGVSVDWLVLAYRHDLAPEILEDEIVPDVPLEEIAEEGSSDDGVTEEQSNEEGEETVSSDENEPSVDEIESPEEESEEISPDSSQEDAGIEEEVVDPVFSADQPSEEGEVSAP